MPNFVPLIERIVEQTGVSFRPASPGDLSKLQALGLPESVLEFYRQFEPSECAEGQVRIWPIDHVLEENDGFVPGCYSSKHGYVVFATTLCGDTYCFDLAACRGGEPRIVLLSHEIVDERTTAADLARITKPVAASLHEFLELFCRGAIDEECIFQ